MCKNSCKNCKCKISIVRGEVIGKDLFIFRCKNDSFEILKNDKVVFMCKSYLLTDDNFTDMVFRARQNAQILSSLNRLQENS